MGDTTPYTHFLMKHSTLTLGDTSVGNFAQFYVETLFCPNPFKSPNYFLALHVPLWNRHNERRLLRFGFDIPENLGNFQEDVSQKQSNGRCPVGVLYTYPLSLDSHWCIRTPMELSV